MLCDCSICGEIFEDGKKPFVCCAHCGDLSCFGCKVPFCNAHRCSAVDRKVLVVSKTAWEEGKEKCLKYSAIFGLRHTAS